MFSKEQCQMHISWTRYSALTVTGGAERGYTGREMMRRRRRAVSCSGHVGVDSAITQQQPTWWWYVGRIHAGCFPSTSLVSHVFSRSQSSITINITTVGAPYGVILIRAHVVACLHVLTYSAVTSVKRSIKSRVGVCTAAQVYVNKRRGRSQKHKKV